MTLNLKRRMVEGLVSTAGSRPCSPSEVLPAERIARTGTFQALGVDTTEVDVQCASLVHWVHDARENYLEGVHEASWVGWLRRWRGSDLGGVVKEPLGNARVDIPSQEAMARVVLSCLG